MRPSLYVVVTEEELERGRRRRGWWLKVARERKGLSQAGAATLLKLSAKSASLVGQWERGAAEPSLRQLQILASLYGVPLSLFTDPPKTDDERLDEIVQLAGEQDLEDQREAAERGPGAGDGRAGVLGRRSA